MENKKKLVCKFHTIKLETGDYGLGIEIDDRHVSLSTSSYSHCPGNYVDLGIFNLTPEDILQIADAIRKVALDLKPELNETLTVGAGI